MDFFGIEDTKKVVDLYLKGRKSLPKDINLVYSDNKKLSDVADMINNLSDYKVLINILERGTDNSYCSSGETLNQLGLELNGLEKELRNCYEYYNK